MDTMREKTPLAAPRPSRDVELAYLVAVQDEARRAARLAQSLFLWKVLLACVTLALTLGVVGSGEELRIGGLSFELKLSVLLLTGCLATFFILVFDYAQYHRAHRLGWQAVLLFEDLGYAVPKADFLRPASPYGMPHLSAFQHEAGWGQHVSYTWAAAGLWAGAWLLIVTTQVVVGLHLADVSGWTLGPCAFFCLPAATFAIGAVRLRLAKREIDERPWYYRTRP